MTYTGCVVFRCCWQFCEMPVSFGYRRKQRTCSDCAQLLKTPPAPSSHTAAASANSSPAMSTSSNGTPATHISGVRALS
jgi:hypothetical protein